MTDLPNHPIKPHVRWMVRRDMPEVLAIEGQNLYDPWTEDKMIKALRKRPCIGLVAEVDDKVVGYMIYNLRKTELHILRLETTPEYEAQFNVRQLFLDKLKDKLSPDRRKGIKLNVHADDLDTQLFMRSQNIVVPNNPKLLTKYRNTDHYPMHYETADYMERIHRGKNKLKKLTEIPWRAVTSRYPLSQEWAKGKLSMDSLRPLKPRSKITWVDADHVGVCSAVPVEDVNTAKEALENWLDRPYHQSRHSEQPRDLLDKGHLLLSVHELRHALLDHETEGQLASSFRPAAGFTESEYKRKPRDDKDDPQR